MFKLVAPGQLTESSLPSRLLHEISGCSYARLTWPLEALLRSKEERLATNGQIGPMLSASYLANAALYNDLPKTK
jgi:hypothetical protein